MNCSEYMQLSGWVTQQNWFHLNRHSQFCKGAWTLNNVLDVTGNVTDVTLCESLPSVEDKSAFLYGYQSYKARQANILCYYECDL